MSIYGHNIHTEHPILSKIAAQLKIYRSPISFSSFIGTLFITKKHFKPAEEILKRLRVQYSMENLKKIKTSIDLLNKFRQGEKDYTDFMRIHMKASQGSSISQMFAFSTMASGSKTLSTQHKTDIATILGEAKNFESATIPAMINDISRAIFSANKSEEFCDMKSERCIEWLETNCQTAATLFDQFMARHGGRGYNEMEISSKSWSEQPEQVVEMVKANLKFKKTLQDFDHHAASVLPVNEILLKIKTPMTFFKKLMMKFWIPRVIRGVEYRETSKALWVTGFSEMRKSIHLMGKMMVNEGLLPDAELVYHLKIDEHYRLMNERDGRLVAKAIRRRKIYEQLKKLKFAEISFGMPRPEVFEKSTLSNEGNILVRGTPVCNGIVTARVCVCKSFDEVHKIKKGDILVTYATDISWSPYFPILEGIVTEIGGLISHGAVVAREYGLPSVIAAANATDLIEDGQMITLNANEGIVMKAE